MSDYTVIIVARDHGRQLLGTLLALRGLAQPAEVVVVDNASRTDLNGVLRLSQLPVRCLRLAEHQSLGAAFNAGLDAASHALVLLLHSDAILLTDPASAITLLERRTEVGVVGAKLFYSGGAPRRVMHAGYTVGVGRVAPAIIGHGEWDHFHDEQEVPAVSGACMALRRSHLRYDERYWFGLEDVDLCLQYRQRGCRAIFLPALQAVHLKASGVNERQTRPRWAVRQIAGRWLYHERWCSDLPLDAHPIQAPLRGEVVDEYFRTVDSAAPPLATEGSEL